MKRKTLIVEGQDWGIVEKASSRLARVGPPRPGYVSLIKLEKVRQKLTVNHDGREICLFDDGYSCLVFLPDGEKWCVSAVYDSSGYIVEWYFDMLKEVFLDHNGTPSYDDLYLDLVVAPDFEYRILDKDELSEALESGEITRADVDMAYETCDKLIREVLPDKEFLEDFLAEQRRILLQ